ncbi:hypothetical protein [Bradyrhizobium stylosanthis]|uniref:hypothetical protein n=1 Tax=Bradyrhizobium stylosanthis TaxID=1803665 RepID=UPI0012E91461|nr:hypothetical protein [Bradyrhizobium stylosanthis]
MDFFKSEREKWAIKLGQAQLRRYPAIPALDALSQQLYSTALPRRASRAPRSGSRTCQLLDVADADTEAAL